MYMLMGPIILTLSILLSAFLLFLIQPLIAKLIIPYYGGSPAVWNTSMVFFQTGLFAGYAYSHWSLKWLGYGRQMVLHAAVLLLPLLMIPPALPSNLHDYLRLHPVPSLMLILLVSIGLPFIALSSNASLTQWWYSLAVSRMESDPYWLYAASNTGSLLGLISYPLIIETALGSLAQSVFWGWGYVAFSAVTLLAMFQTFRSHLDRGDVDRGVCPRVDPASVEILTRKRRGFWLLRSAVASSLLLSTTLHITTDLASVPMFWVFPLAVYLLTFILAFAFPQIPRRPIALLTIIGTAITLFIILLPGPHGLIAILLPSLALLFVGALLCHADLSADRPQAVHLTEFYLWITFGGMLGGLLNTLLAPRVFNSVAEYPLTLALLSWLVYAKPGAEQMFSGNPRHRQSRFFPPATMTIVILLAAVALKLDPHAVHWLLVPPLVLLLGFLLARYPGQFASACSLVALFLVLGPGSHAGLVEQKRSFFGVSRVLSTDSEKLLMHGSTIHGSQLLDPGRSGTLTKYYYRKGPISSVILNLQDNASIGVVGLGVGSVSALTRRSQTLTYFEIDPLIEDLARRHFTYLADAPSSTEVVIGDGRLSLEVQPRGRFDLLFLDAFTSDALPVHLITREAVMMYLDRLSADGILLIHLTNRYLNLTRVMRALAPQIDRHIAVNDYIPTQEELEQGAVRILVAAIPASQKALEGILELPGWQELPKDGDSVLWTDDHHNLIRVFDLRGSRAGF